MIRKERNIAMNRPKICCLFGGRSEEYEVSLVSCSCVLREIDREKWDVVTVGVTKQGMLYRYDGEISAIETDAWRLDKAHLRPAAFVPGEDGGYLLSFDGKTGAVAAREKIDAAFPVMHGTFCEDGRLQGYLDLCKIPYVGAPCAASAVAMDKVFTKRILQGSGIRQAAYTVLGRVEIEADPAAAAEKAARVAAFPLFVKPANAGSSVGVCKAKDLPSLARALCEAARYDEKVLTEETITGREIEVAVLGGANPMAATPGEIEPGAEFYDYMDKYKNGKSRAYIPARIKPQTAQKLREQAVLIFRLLGCRGLSRVDFFVRERDGEEEIVFNEINTLPGFTPISMYPKMMQHEGLSYSALIDRLLCLALEDAKERT